MAPFIDCVALGMVGRGEDLLNPKRVQEHGPNGANELSAAIREEFSGGAKVGDDMPHEGLADCACGVITGRDEDGVLGEAIYEDNQAFVASIGRKRAHNIDGQCIPWSLGLDGACRFLAVAIIGAQLALGATLSGLQTDAAACFMGVPVTEELPQSVATEVGCDMEFAGDFPGFFFVL